MMLLELSLLTRSTDMIYFNDETNGNKQLVWTSPWTGRKHVFFYGNYFLRSELISAKEETQSTGSRKDELEPERAKDATSLEAEIPQVTEEDIQLPGPNPEIELIETTMEDAIQALKHNLFQSTLQMMHQQNGQMSLRFVEKGQVEQEINKSLENYVILTQMDGPILPDRPTVIVNLENPEIAALDHLIKIINIAQDHTVWFQKQHFFRQWLQGTIYVIQRLALEQIGRIMNELWKRIPDIPLKRSKYPMVHLLSQNASSLKNAELKCSISRLFDNLSMDLILEFWHCATQQLIIGLEASVPDWLHRAQCRCQQLNFGIDPMFIVYRRKLSNMMQNNKSMMRELLEVKDYLQEWMTGDSSASITEVNALYQIRQHSAFFVDLGTTMRMIDHVAEWLLLRDIRRHAVILSIKGEGTPNIIVLRLVEQMLITKNVIPMGFGNIPTAESALC